MPDEIRFIPPAVPSKAEQIKKLQTIVLDAIALYNPAPAKNQKDRTATAAGIIAVHLFTKGVRALLLLLSALPLRGGPYYAAW